MRARLVGSTRSGVRWRDDGWELRCASCAKTANTSCYWPLTDEFWDRTSGMMKCRACQRSARNARDRKRIAADNELRARRAAESRQYRIDAADGIRVMRDLRRPESAVWQRQSYWLNPEKHRAISRASYERNREAVCARRRAAYAQRKAA